ncbi:hypothetical protein QK342_15290 [Myroides odoratimimus]|uniref:hypothetical protein n=1 Tax=Myroides odoratimimus TaxID=76832 RepID=UPI00103B071E|nr:hypothetical protein [Myroides odoratimimus]QBK77605.1 hypothetical protein E0Z07_15230 [Myroides odoratimimus]WHT73053.1 hypothetical protein QK342_15290 [Myroides odoratimimus]WHU37636.1 hypothetical protein QNM93_15275 [Myroides odoratimimus]
MPLPIIIGIAAAVAGGTGVGLGIHGGVKMKKANDKLKLAQEENNKNLERLEQANTAACAEMDELGKNEMRVLANFKEFSDLFERIHNRPDFKDIKIGGVEIPEFKGSEIKDASVGASILVGGLGGAALGTAGGFAASGATTAAVMALGTASTGTAISTLSGVAATNATLAALGGGPLAAGGGGMALGATVLGAATLGVGLLVGGVIFSLTGSAISGKAEKAMEQMKENEVKINEIYHYLLDLKNTAVKYNSTLLNLESLYIVQLRKMRRIVNSSYEKFVNWEDLSKDEQLIIENTVLIVGALYNMCKVQLVLKLEDSDRNKINKEDIENAKNAANDLMSKLDSTVV